MHMSQPNAQISLARLYYKQKRYWESVEICEKVLLAYPGWVRALFYKGESLFAMGKIAEAQVCYEDACEKNHDFLIGCIRSARAFMKLGEFERAESRIRSVLEKDNKNIDALRMKSFILLKKGRKSEAMAVFEILAKINPDDEWVQKFLKPGTPQE